LPAHKIDGLDISDVITGKSDKSPHEVLYFYYHQNDLESLRSGKWKLEMARSYNSLNGRPGGKDGKMVQYESLKIPQPALYDLDSDVGQKRDVSADYPDVMKKLMMYVDATRADLGDGLVKQKGAGRRQSGRAGKDAVYPSDPAFPKAFDAKYRPGMKKNDA
jgi:hypothetical protein